MSSPRAFVRSETTTECHERRDQDICVMNADGGDVENLTETEDVYENYPAWGPEAK